MSCVVGIKQGGKVWVGGDSRAGGEFCDTLTGANSKVYRCGPLLIGHTGSMRTAQIIRFVFKPKEYKSNIDPVQYLVTEFALPLRKLLEEHGATYEEDEDKDKAGGDTSAAWLLIGFAGRIFHMEGNFAVYEYEDDFGAEGSGASFALGVLEATSRGVLENTSREIHPKERIELALRIAAKRDPGGVGPPFVIESIGG